MALDDYYADMYKNMGIEVGNVIVSSLKTNFDDMRLSDNEYPLSDKQILEASDCQLILWIKFLPTPSTTEHWNIIDVLIRFAEKRMLIKRFTDVRSESLSTPYYGAERRTTKPLRIF